MNLYLQILLLASALSVGTQACFAELRTRDPTHVVPLIKERIEAIQKRNTNATQPSTKTALINVRIFDGYRIKDPSTVFIHDGIISFNPIHYHSATVIDGEGGILLPGFIDSHCHPTSVTDLDALSSYGVTTVLSMACPDYELCASLRSLPAGQTTSFFTAGYPAVAPNSTHALFLPLKPGSQIASTSQVSSFVSDTFNNHSSWLKLIAESNGLSQEIQNTLVSSTHALGKTTMTHAADIHSYQQAILSQTDGIQHVVFDSALTPEMVAQISSQGQHITPTLNIGRTLLPQFQAPPLSQKPGNWTAALTSVSLLHAAGVPILAGTDAITGLSFIKPIPMGVTLHWEMENLVEAGMSVFEALRAATMVPARVHGLTDRRKIGEGMRADLVLLKRGVGLADVEGTHGQ